MQAIIFAGKKDENSHVHPRAMKLVSARPVLEHVLNSLPKRVKEVVLVVGFRGDKIQNYFGKDYRGREIHYVWEYQSGQVESALKRAHKIFRYCEEVMIVDGHDIGSTAGESEYMMAQN